MSRKTNQFGQIIGQGTGQVERKKSVRSNNRSSHRSCRMKKISSVKSFLKSRDVLGRVLSMTRKFAPVLVFSWWNSRAYFRCFLMVRAPPNIRGNYLGSDRPQNRSWGSISGSIHLNSIGSVRFCLGSLQILSNIRSRPWKNNQFGQTIGQVTDHARGK